MKDFKKFEQEYASSIATIKADRVDAKLLPQKTADLLKTKTFAALEKQFLVHQAHQVPVRRKGMSVSV